MNLVKRRPDYTDKCENLELPKIIAIEESISLEIGDFVVVLDAAQERRRYMRVFSQEQAN